MMSAESLSSPRKKGFHYALLESKRDEIINMAHKYGAYNVRICGSVARGEDTEGSDIDLLVQMEQGSSLLSLGLFLMDLQSLLGCKIDILTENELKSEFVKESLTMQSHYEK